MDIFKQKIRRIRQSVASIPRRVWMVFLFLFVAAVSGDVFANILQGEAPFGLIWRCYPVLSLIGWGVVIVVVFLAATGAIYLRRNDFFIQRVQKIDSKNFPARRGVALFVSTSNQELTETESGSFLLTFRDKDKKSVETIELGKDTLSKESGDLSELEKSKKSWNWHQILRAINRHAKAVDFLYLIGSADRGVKEGSCHELGILSRLLNGYLTKDPAFSGRTISLITHDEEGVDFEDIDALRRAVQVGIERFLKEGLENRDIAIDITGGQKATSIAGAAATLENDDIVFQYVQTNPPFDVEFYDFRIRSSDVRTE